MVKLSDVIATTFTLVTIGIVLFLIISILAIYKNNKKQKLLSLNLENEVNDLKKRIEQIEKSSK